MFYKREILFWVVWGQIVICLSGFAVAATDSAAPPQLPLITVEVQHELLKKVIESIALQTNYDIAIDEKMGDLVITGNFTQVSVDNFFKRTLRDANISVIYNDVDRKILVRLFGQKDSVKYISAAATGNSELRQRNLAQAEEYKKSKEEPDYVDMSGMTNAEKWEKYQEQNEEYKESKEDPNYVDASGMTNAEKWAKYQGQNEEHKRSKEDPNYVDVSGMTNSEKMEKYQQQDENYKRSKEDPNYTDMSGMTNAEKWEKYKKQDEEYNKSANRYSQIDM